MPSVNLPAGPPGHGGRSQTGSHDRFVLAGEPVRTLSRAVNQVLAPRQA